MNEDAVIAQRLYDTYHVELYLDHRGILKVFPKGAYNDFSREDKHDLQTHKPGLTALVASHMHPRLPEEETRPPANGEEDRGSQCAYCGQVCVGPADPNFALLHWNDPAEAARRDVAAKSRDSFDRSTWHLHNSIITWNRR